jgi:hypothetical protein
MHITARSAKIGNQIQSRSEQHGEESVTAIDIPLTDIMLDERELNALLCEPYAHAALFDHRRVASIIAPMFPRLKALAMTERLEDATVVITHGLDRETLRLTPVRVTKIKLTPCVGGLTAMSCTVQSTPDLDVNVAHLLERLNSEVEIEIECGQFGAQAELPLVDEPEARADTEVQQDEESHTLPSQRATRRRSGARGNGRERGTRA